MFNLLKINTDFFATFALYLVILTATASVHGEVFLNGVAAHSELGNEMFIAGLYTTTPSSDKNAILNAREEKQIQVRVTANRLSLRRFKGMWLEGMAVNASPAELRENSANMASFINMLKVKLIAGDIFTVGKYDTDINGVLKTTVRVMINGATLGEISDAKFFDLLLRTWLGPVPLSSSFRSALTRSGDIDATLLARFESTTPNDERVAVIEEALRPLPLASSGETGKSFAPPKVSIVPPKVSISQPITKIVPLTTPPELVIAPPTIQTSAPEIADATNLGEPQVAIIDPAPEMSEPTPLSSLNQESEKSIDSVFEDEESGGGDLTAESILSQQFYVTDLKRHSNKFMVYPDKAIRRSYEGNVRVEVIINREGKVLQVKTLEESKHKVLTKSATRGILKASPFPSVPEDVGGDTFTFSVPVVFQLTDK